MSQSQGDVPTQKPVLHMVIQGPRFLPSCGSAILRGQSSIILVQSWKRQDQRWLPSFVLKPHWLELRHKSTSNCSGPAACPRRTQNLVNNKVLGCGYQNFGGQFVFSLLVTHAIYIPHYYKSLILIHHNTSKC